MEEPALTAGDAAALAALYDDVARQLIRFAEGLRTGPGLPTGHDLAMQTWQRAVEHWQLIGPWERPRQVAWLYKTCRRMRIDELRRLKRHQQIAPQLLDDEITADDELEQRALGRIALKECSAALQNMPPRQRQVARMAWLLHMSREDIAEQLGMNQATIRVHLSQARKTLEKDVRPHLPFPLAADEPTKTTRDERKDDPTGELGRGGA